MDAKTLRHYARIGAKAELERIYANFPELRERRQGEEPAVKARKPVAEKRHWTQTPEGKRKLARAVKASWRTRRGAAVTVR